MEGLGGVGMPVLDGKNYMSWKMKMLCILRVKGLEALVFGARKSDLEVKLADDATEAEKPAHAKQLAERATKEARQLAQEADKENKAFMFLTCALDERHLALIRTCTTARQIWQRIETEYADREPISVDAVLTEFYTYSKKPKESISDYTAHIDDLVSKMALLGSPLSDEAKMAKVLSGLPEEYSGLKRAWNLTPASFKSMDLLLTNMRREEKALGESVSDALIARQGKPGKRTDKKTIQEMKNSSKCKICDQPGHWWKECPQKPANYVPPKRNKKGKPNERAAQHEERALVAHAGDDDSEAWYMDSGASYHMTGKRDWIVDYQPLVDRRPIRVGNGEWLFAIGKGVVPAVALHDGYAKPIRLTNVYYVPKLSDNLFSISATTTQSGVDVKFTGDKAYIMDGNETIATGSKADASLFKMNIRVPMKASIARTERTLQEWHEALGHADKRQIEHMAKSGCVDGMKIVTHTQNQEGGCGSCQEGKGKAASHSVSSRPRATHILERIHMDLVGPIKPMSASGMAYFLLMKDEYSSYLFVEFMSNKSQVPEKLRRFVNLVTTMRQTRIGYFRSDNGSEFVNREVQLLCDIEGISTEFSSPYTPQQNGAAERANRTVIETARSSLAASKLPLTLWAEAVNTSVYVRNRTSNSNTAGKTPFELFHGHQPDIAHLIKFGQPVHIVDDNRKESKFSPRTLEAFMVGYGPRVNTYRCLLPNLRDVAISPRVVPANHRPSSAEQMDKTTPQVSFWIEPEAAPQMAPQAAPQMAPQAAPRMAPQAAPPCQPPSAPQLQPPNGVLPQAGSAQAEETPATFQRPTSENGTTASSHDIPAPSAPPSLSEHEEASVAEQQRLRRDETFIVDKDAPPAIEQQQPAESPPTLYPSLTNDEFPGVSQEAQQWVKDWLNPISRVGDFTIDYSGARFSKRRTTDTQQLSPPATVRVEQPQTQATRPIQAQPTTRPQTRRATALQRSHSMAAPATAAPATNPSPRFLNRIMPAVNSLINRTSATRPAKNLSAMMLCEPSSYSEAIAAPDAAKWQEAIRSELAAHAKNRTWTIVTKPNGSKEISAKWVFKRKIAPNGEVDKYKARLVARGFTQVEGIDYSEVFAPVVRMDSVRLLFSFAVQFDYNYRQLDISTAFLNGDVEEELYLQPPEGLSIAPGCSLKLNRSLYGLKQSPRCWNRKLKDILAKLGLQQTSSDPCVYVSRGAEIILACYVDDMLLFAKDSRLIDSLIKDLSASLEVNEVTTSCFVGIEIERQGDGSILLHQASYIQRMLERYGMLDANGIATPLEHGHALNKIEVLGQPVCEIPDYPKAIGSLLWCAMATRPDITHALSVLSKHTKSPREAHWKAVKRVFRYLKATLDHGLLYRKVDHPVLSCYTDADWGGDQDNRKSTSGVITFYNTGPISFSSRQQPVVALSTTEAEYIAATVAVKDLIWIARFLSELKVPKTSKPELICDNRSALKLIRNPEFHERTKHIDIRYHFIRSWFETGLFDLESISTDEQLADIFTKALGSDRHKYINQSIGCISRNDSLGSDE